MKTTFAILLSLLCTQHLYAANKPAKWVWSSEIPEQFRTTVPRANRIPAAIDALFIPSRPTLAQLVTALGQPDGFSRQYMYSFTEGSTMPIEQGGTLRFLLNDGGELHIQSYDRASVGLAIRYDSKRRGHLLYK
ncbi:MAG: hypothetical protein JWL90_3611 [Chthoniobacteraceae bacterium]|nr:hypothetical protein [Chthoniobacteraceae bacterium]